MTLIRSYTAADYKEVREILKEGNLFWAIDDTAEALERKIRENPGTILVAEEAGRPVGNVFVVSDWNALIFRLAVRQDSRGGRIGPMLLQAAEEKLRSDGRTVASVIVDNNKKALQRGYEALGYVPGELYRWMSKEL
jgi:predicted N-acetyltransferase YhbS